MKTIQTEAFQEGSARTKTWNPTDPAAFQGCSILQSHPIVQEVLNHNEPFWHEQSCTRYTKAGSLYVNMEQTCTVKVNLVLPGRHTENAGAKGLCSRTINAFSVGHCRFFWLLWHFYSDQMFIPIARIHGNTAIFQHKQLHVEMHWWDGL